MTFQAAPRPRSRRRWSLRGPILAILVLGVLLGRAADRIRVRREAVRAIQRAGGGALYEWPFRGGGPNHEAEPGWPRWLVDRLGPDAPGSVVCVFHMEVPEQSPIFPALGRLEGLRRLELGGPGVTDKGMAHLAQLRRLRILSVGTTDVGEPGLAPIGSMTNLEELNLNATRVGDAGLDHLKDLRSLKILYLAGTRVTDEGLRRLKDFPSLEALSLADTRISDAGLQHLAAIRSLQFVALDRSGRRDGSSLVTGPGVEALRRARPDLQIDY